MLSNHTCYADPHVLFELSFKGKFCLKWLAGIEPFDTAYGIFGWFIQSAGVFSIDRGIVDRHSLKMAQSILDEGEFPLVIYPEGEADYTNKVLQHFYPGAALFAINTANRFRESEHIVEIIPLRISYRFIGSPESTLSKGIKRFYLNFYRLAEREGVQLPEIKQAINNKSLWEELLKALELGLFFLESRYYPLTPSLSSDCQLEERIERVRDNLLQTLQEEHEPHRSKLNARANLPLTSALSPIGGEGVIEDLGRIDSWVHEDADSPGEAKRNRHEENKGPQRALASWVKQHRQGVYTEINDAAEQRIDEEDAPQGPKCQHALMLTKNRLRSIIARKRYAPRLSDLDKAIKEVDSLFARRGSLSARDMKLLRRIERQWTGISNEDFSLTPLRSVQCAVHSYQTLDTATPDTVKRGEGEIEKRLKMLAKHLNQQKPYALALSKAKAEDLSRWKRQINETRQIKLLTILLGDLKRQDRSWEGIDEVLTKLEVLFLSRSVNRGPKEAYVNVGQPLDVKRFIAEHEGLNQKELQSLLTDQVKTAIESLAVTG